MEALENAWNLFKNINKDIRTISKTLFWCSDVFIATFEQTSHIILVLALLFEQVNAGLERTANRCTTPKTFTCSKSTIETLEKGKEYVQS